MYLQRYWRPFFNSQFPLPKTGITTIQREVSYWPTPQSYALDIERAITSSVKNAMRRWRSQRKRGMTTFHPDACAVAKDLLSMIDDFLLGRDSLLNSSIRYNNSRDRSESASYSRDRSDTLNSQRNNNNLNTTNQNHLGNGTNFNASSGGFSGSNLNRFQQLANDQMAPVLRNRDLFGYPINIPFTGNEL